MPDPTARLDARYSQPAAAATPWHEARAALERAELFWLSTSRPGGGPHVTPVVAVFEGGQLHFMTGATEQKYANLVADPRVALTTGCADWEGGLDLVVEGTAAHVTDDATLARLAAVWATKWDGRWTLAVGDGCLHHGTDDESLAHRVEVFTVHATRAYAHAKSPFAHTRYDVQEGP